MKSNRKGSFVIEYSMIIFFVIVIIAFIVISTKTQKTTFNSNVEQIEQYADKMIVNIEEEGYITELSRFKLENHLNDLGIKHYEINGTENKANKGEPVFLAINVSTKNLRGGVLNSHRIAKEGISR